MKKARINYAKIFEDYASACGDTLLSSYKTNRDKVTLRCSKGHDFNVTPTHYKHSGSRCTKCKNLSPEQAEDKFLNLAKSKDERVLTKYINVHTKVEILCKYGHNYSVTPHNYTVAKSGCPICARNHGIKSLYILKDVSNSNISKIGISFNPWVRCSYLQRMSDNYCKGLHNFEIFYQWDLSLEPQRAVDIESSILQQFSNNKLYKGEKPFSGATEILEISPEELEKVVDTYW